jgi:hypothetical protein
MVFAHHTELQLRDDMYDDEVHINSTTGTRAFIRDMYEALGLSRKHHRSAYHVPRYEQPTRPMSYSQATQRTGMAIQPTSQIGVNQWSSSMNSEPKKQHELSHIRPDHSSGQQFIQDVQPNLNTNLNHGHAANSNTKKDAIAHILSLLKSIVEY